METEMSSTENHDEELKDLLQSMTDDLMTHYYSRCFYFLGSMGLHSELDDKESIPLEIWAGIAQALADASGYRVNLQAQVFEPVEDDPKRLNQWVCVKWRLLHHTILSRRLRAVRIWVQD